MKFDFCIGNPPYQETLENTSDKPVYNEFMDAAFGVADKVELITPARFLFDAGKTPKEWNKKMLDDECFKVKFFEQDSSKVFPNTDIQGGVAVTYRDSTKNFGAIKSFAPYPELNSTLHKVIETDFISLNEIIVTSFAWHYTEKMHEDYPKAASKLSKGHAYDIKSNAFEKLPEVFHTTKPNDGYDYIQIYGRINNERAFRYIRRDYVKDVINIDKYKLMLPKAYGCDAIGEGDITPVISVPVICGPAIGTTETFISIGAFKTKKEAENCYKYLLTRFARAMLGILKITQDLTPSKWQYVPLQDFSQKSDINWNESIAEIDKQLYKKYGLTKEEIEFIETHVKEMD